MKTLFESDKIKVYKNNSNEIFHLNKITGVILRINSTSHSTTITSDISLTTLSKQTNYCRVINEPTLVNGKNGIRFERIDYN